MFFGVSSTTENVILTLVFTLSMSVIFGISQYQVGIKYDHPRARAGLGYKKIGFVPVSHHYLECIAFLFFGWSYRMLFGIMQIIYPYATARLYWFPTFSAILLVLVISVVGYVSLPSWNRKYSLPKEPQWHYALVICVLSVSFLIGFFARLPKL